MMSIEAVVGRINQIISFEQQVSSPASLASSTATTGTTGTLPATDPSAGGSMSFGDMLATAQAAPVTDPALGAAPVTDPAVGAGGPQVQAMTAMANSLLGKPYVYGGGHAGFGPSAGYDCSGFVSAVLHAGGYLSQPADTTTLPDQPGILPGPGQSVTIYDRDEPGQTGHVIIDIDGQFYESGGMAGPWGGGGGVEKIAQPSAAYLATFTTILHPSGL